MSPGSASPRGLGVYTSRIVREWDDRRAQKEIAEYLAMRCRYVLLCVEAADGFRVERAVLVDVAGHLRAAGLRVGVYALPSERAWLSPESLADRLADAGEAIGSDLWVPDVEEQARGRGMQVRRFRRTLTDRASERVSIMVTAYGRIPRAPRPARPGDRLFPWGEIVGWGTLGYQLYRTAEEDRAVDQRMADAEVHWGGDVVPHLATYLGGAERLAGDLDRTCLDAGGRVIVPGVAIWQDSTTDAAERDVLARFVERHGW